jgi:hypothetical protein
MTGVGSGRNRVGRTSSANRASDAPGASSSHAAGPSRPARSGSISSPPGLAPRQSGRASGTSSGAARVRNALLPEPVRRAAERVAALETRDAQLDEVIRLLGRLRTSGELALKTRDNRFHKSTLKDALALMSMECSLDNKAAAASGGLASAGIVLSTMRLQVATEMAQTWEDVSSGLAAGSSSDARPVMTQAVDRLKQQAADIRDCRGFALAVVDTARAAAGGDTPSAVEPFREPARRRADEASDLQRFVALKAASVHKVRMLLHAMPPVAREAFDEVQALIAGIEWHDAAVEGAGDGPQADEVRASHARVIGSLLDPLDKAADRFAEAAAQTWSEEGDGPQRWVHSLEYAETLGSLADAFRSLVERYPPAPADEELAHPDEDREGAQPKPAPGPARPLPPSRLVQRPEETGPSGAPAIPPELPPALSVALDRADRLLRAGRRLTLDAVSQAGGDPLLLARGIGKDTSAIELMITDGHDPMSIAAVVRSSVQGWFGDLDRLRKAREQLGSLQAEPGAVAQSRLSRLDERIAALEAVEAHVLADEVAALKRLERPKEKHVDRLLALGEIQAVTRPVRLPSDGDVGARGTLFEMVIQPRRLPGGETPAPIFLHLHTRQAISEDQCLGLEHAAFAAVHVKNAWQKNLGSRWEQMQSSREGAEVPRVHRGRVRDALWDKLRAQVR